MNRFQDKTAIITGGTKGIGLAVAHQLGREGASILITARTQSDLDRTVDELTTAGVDAFAVCADMASPSIGEDLANAAMDRWGRIDVLVNNAGLFDEAAFGDIAVDSWRYILDAMLTGPFLLAQSVSRHMRAVRRGSIVNVSSIDVHAADGPFASYGAAKGGLVTMTRYMAVELGPHNVRCNVLSPGWVDTPMMTSEMSGDERETLMSGFDRIPLRRLLSAQEIASACAFLASDEASGINGVDFIVDGGALADAYIIPIADSLVKVDELTAASGEAGRG